MNKFVFVLFFAFQFTYAQDTVKIRKNEIRFDVLSAIALSKVNLSIERPVCKKYTAGVSVSYGISNKLIDHYKSSYMNSLSKFEIVPFFRFKLSNSNKYRYYFGEIFTSYNNGLHREILRAVDESNNGYYFVKESIYNDVAIGASFGYKMYFSERWTGEFLLGAGRNLINTKISPDYIPRVSINLGYRF